LADITIDFGTPPNFVNVDGDIHWEAWRVLRRLAQLD
jgi:hypothetical protein